MTVARTLLLLLLVTLFGCPSPWPQWDIETTDTAAATTSSPEPEPTGGEILTSTVAPSPTGDPPEETTAEQLDPTIVAHELNPNPITTNGLIDVTVTAEHADAVTMTLEDGLERDLVMTEPGVFSGSIEILSSAQNGQFVALLTPSRDDESGKVVLAKYSVALPEAGTQSFWETGDLIGKGQVAALGVLPDGDVIEFGTLATADGPRCYLRRRDQGGAWKQSNVLEILPGVGCSAIDLSIDAQGVMHVLAGRKAGNDTRWWLARIPAWKADPDQIRHGDPGETAVALAAGPSGTIAACGFAPTPALDDDARAWIFPPGNAASKTLSFDYLPPKKDMPQIPNAFSERVRDCVFVDDNLALVGEAYGNHEPLMERDRLFILRLDPRAPETATWHVDPGGAKAQSGAQAVAVDGLGRLLIGGYVCDDACVPDGELRVYDAEDHLDFAAFLGSFPTKQLCVQDLAWSPVGYAVVATGGVMGAETAFTVRAFDLNAAEPVWTFAREDVGVLNVAFALAIGKFGQVYAGGIGENSFPCVAYICG